MRRRLYFVLPDAPSARRTVDDLLLARIEIGRMHCLARRGSDLTGLPEASYLQKSDLVHGAELGLGIGGLCGLALGAVLVFGPLLPGPLPLATILVAAVIGAVLGAWMSSMLAASVPNSRLAMFAEAIAAGQYLLMIDVPYHRLGEIRALVTRHHPEAESGGVEPTIPAFP